MTNIKNRYFSFLLSAEMGPKASYKMQEATSRRLRSGECFKSGSDCLKTHGSVLDLDIPFQVGGYIGSGCTRVGSFVSLWLIPPGLPGVGATPHQVHSRFSKAGQSTGFA